MFAMSFACTGVTLSVCVPRAVIRPNATKSAVPTVFDHPICVTNNDRAVEAFHSDAPALFAVAAVAAERPPTAYASTSDHVPHHSIVASSVNALAATDRLPAEANTSGTRSWKKTSLPPVMSIAAPPEVNANWNVSVVEPTTK